MSKCHIQNASIVNENETFTGDILIEGNVIRKVSRIPLKPCPSFLSVNAGGKYLIPGVIDDQVHFREPGLTHKADIASESKAAVAGGVTSFMEMPNTIPQTTTKTELNRKFGIAAESSYANYSFYLGATNNNIKAIRNLDPSSVCGVKLFMGSSTGNMLVDKMDQLEKIFAESPTIIVTHCEDEIVIQRNLKTFSEKYGENIPVNAHPLIRSAEACFLSSSLAVSLAEKYKSRLQILHISTDKELELFDNTKPLIDKLITAEVCVHHLWFNDQDYEKKGSLIKWNPAIKSESDRKGLLNGVLTDKLDMIATDHAPHTVEEKSAAYLKCPSGAPMIQHSLQIMMELVRKGQISMEKLVEKMCHAPAIVFGIEKRGFIREGYYADLVIVDPETITEVTPDNLHYKCKWSPLEGELLHSAITHTFVNGELAWCHGVFNEQRSAMKLKFNR